MVEFLGSNKDIVYCFVDNTWQYNSAWTVELIKNQSDYTITSLVSKGYTVLQGLDADELLKAAAKRFNHAVVFSTGTEFINGINFFEEIKKLIETDYFVAGHILNRGDAGWELHHQCFTINLKKYVKYGSPEIGKQYLGATHISIEPIYSTENYHDEYTPVWIKKGHLEKTYNHKCNGWNILDVAFLNNEPVIVYNESLRNNKKHYYPENQIEFLKHSDWIYQRESFCSTTMIHENNTEWTNKELSNIEQVFSPASGMWWKSYISKDCHVILYDYNDKALNYWKEQTKNIKNIKFDFKKINLLTDDTNILDEFDNSKNTLINLSNIFAYEGTTFLTSLEKRLYKESEWIYKIKEKLPQAWINFSTRACTGFIEHNLLEKAKDTKIYKIKELTKPTWHMNGDWNEHTI